MGVEDIAAQSNSMIRQFAVARPRGRHLSIAVNESHAGESMGAEFDRVDLEQTQFVDRPRCEGVAARLVPGDRSLLDDRDVMTRSGQPRGDGRPGRTAADDEDVGVQSACRQPADAGEPGMASGPTGVMSAMAGTSGDVKSYVPASSSANTGESTEHQVSYSSAHSALVGSAPPRS